MIDTIDYTIEGNPDGPTVVFVHGWPDNPGVWRHQVTALKAQYRCVLLTLPNLGATPQKSGGYDFPVLVEMLDHTIDEVLPVKNDRMTLVTHDWGAYLGYLYEQTHPQRVARMVALDIGGHMKQTSLKSVLMVISYQWALIASWLAGGIAPAVGDWMSRQVAKVIRVPAPRAGNVRSRYNYFYYYFWRAILLPGARRNLLTRYRPACPVLYLYGGNKPVMFHTDRWLAIVAEHGGESLSLDDAGHWFMETHPEQVNTAIARWLAS